jgi:hypothetical protein
MFEGLVRFIGKLRAPRTLEGVLAEYEAGRRHPVLPPLLIALGEFVASQPVEARSAWRALLLHLDDITGAEPTKKWMTQLRALVGQVHSDDLEPQVLRWLGLIDLAACHFSSSLTKGLVWVTVCLDADRVAPELGALAERANRKVAGLGQMSRNVVNACLRVLGRLDSELAVSQLTRLKGVIEYRDANHQLDQAFESAATKRDLSVDELEERVVPDVGGLTSPLGAWTPTISFEDGAPLLSWVRDDGKRVQRVPAELQREHADEVAARKAKFAEFEDVLEAQASRLERLFWTQRSIPLEGFRSHTLGHPIVLLLARALVWNVGDRAALWFDDAFVDVAGTVFEPPPSATVQLWHPALASASDLVAWRARLEALGLTQPFAQVDRPVFTLDATEHTGTLTRRWEGRRLRQQRLQVACRRYQWASTRIEPGQADAVAGTYESFELRVLLEVAADGRETTASNASTWLRSGAVRFQSPRELAAIPKVVLSEVLLEVDAIVQSSSS